MSLYWISFFAAQNSIPVAAPGTKEIVGLWHTGPVQGNRAQIDTMSCLVVADCPFDAKTIIENEWGDRVIGWRFDMKQKSPDMGAGFPLSKWMRKRIDRMASRAK